MATADVGLKRGGRRRRSVGSIYFPTLRRTKPPILLAPLSIILIGDENLHSVVRGGIHEEAPALRSTNPVEKQGPTRSIIRQNHPMECIPGEGVEPPHLMVPIAPDLVIPAREQDAESPRPRVIMQAPVWIAANKAMEIETPAENGGDVVALQVATWPSSIRRAGRNPVIQCSSRFISFLRWYHSAAMADSSTCLPARGGTALPARCIVNL